MLSRHVGGEIVVRKALSGTLSLMLQVKHLLWVIQYLLDKCSVFQNSPSHSL